MQLCDRAWAEGSQRRAVDFLTRPDVQTALEICFLAAAISSLPVERRHAELKRWETSRLVHVAAASRNALLNRLMAGRLEAEALFSPAKSELDRVMRCGIRQVAMHLRPDLAIAGPQYLAGAAGESQAAVGPWRQRGGPVAPLGGTFEKGPIGR